MYSVVVAITACDVYLERFKSAWELGTLDLHLNLRQAKPSKQLTASNTAQLRRGCAVSLPRAQG
jgi:hypothetical protein